MFLISTILWILLGKLRGGSLRELARADIRRTEVIFAVLAGRFLLYSGYLKIPAPVAGVIHTALFALLAWVLFGNLHIPGMNVAMAGSALNTAVIAANGGRMPVSQYALLHAGIWDKTGEALSQGIALTHTLAGPGTKLWLLGDVLYLRWPWGSGVAYSVGDLLLIAGMFIAIQHLMGVGRREKQALTRG